MHHHARTLIGGATAAVLALGGIAAGAAPAFAGVSPSAPVIIDEVYGGGGNSGAVLNQDFVELYNPGASPVSLAGWSVQYGSATGAFNAAQVTPLSGTIPAGGSFLLGLAVGGANGAALPTPDGTGTANLSGTNGKVALVSSTTPLTCGQTAGSGCATDASVVDFVGFGTANAFAGSAAAPAPSNTTSISRTAHANTANNAADFIAGAPTPANSGGGGGTDPGDGEYTIAEIQGTGAASPIAGATATTTGVVTAAYPTGGFNGFIIQTAGTGGAIDLSTHTASDALFIFGSAATALVEVGDHVEVTGTVTEFNGLTEITADASGVTILDTPATVEPAVVGWPATAEGRETLESMLIQPAAGAFTVSNTYSTNQYGEVGLAFGPTPLIQPTEVGRPGSPEAAAAAADNAARGVLLDDGATTNFFSNTSATPPYISTSAPVRVGAAVTFDQPVIVDWRNNAWKLNPTTAFVAGGTQPVSFENDRTESPEDVGGDVTVASFNVLNYFTTLGSDVTNCVAYEDRAGDPVTVDECTGTGPRGAWDPADFDAQEGKLVDAINALDADVVGLLEIENSAALGEEADEALATLVDALNEAAGTEKWAFVPSSDELPSPSLQDVITNALIYQPAAVELVGDPRALGDLSDSGEAFANAREPIGASFAPVAGGESLFVTVNHLKSKGSGGPWPGDVDTGDGQGSSNESRVRQATALVEWIDTVTEAGDAVAIVGDLNSYTEEDPMHVLYDAGYADAVKALSPGEYSYSFSGLSGSLDHVVLNEAALARATGADVWEINAEEAIALEYSRANYHGTDFLVDGPYRSSDHDPVVVGLDDGLLGSIDLTFLNFNDFHGRIDANTVKFAGTIEAERAAAEAAGGQAVLLSAGDSIGASLFASATADDVPTLDVLDALDLKASAVGNHEFDKGFADLTDRVIPSVDFPILGANVYLKGTTTPALQEYAIVDMGGVQVGVIGAVTQQTPSLVTPAGIATIDFGDPVEAVNRVAAQLSDGDPANGEADVIVAEYHEGADTVSEGNPNANPPVPPSTLEEELAESDVFAAIVNDTSPVVDVIFNGHTHQPYAWQAPVTGAEVATRPIAQAVSYGDRIASVKLTYDRDAGEVTASTAKLVNRTTTADATLVATYPRVAEVKTIVDAALANAAIVGNQPIGSITGDITTAYQNGTYGPNGYQAERTNTNRDQRGLESSLGGLVANALRDTLATDQYGAQIGIVNPGGMRSELFYPTSTPLNEGDGVVTYAEANGVLPFVNNLWTVTLTGDELLDVLEEQWQRASNGGPLPTGSRPYLQLGLSDNVTYTFDPAAAMDEHITSVMIDGEPLDPAAEYRVATFSFLATGGDNFWSFRDGEGVDTGLVDRDAWISYLQAHPGLAPDYARQAVQVPVVPGFVEAGAALSVDVAGLDLTSLGAPLNTTVEARLDGTAIGSFPVAAGAAAVDVVIPEGTAEGAHVLTLVASPSNTTVTLPITVEVPEPEYPVWNSGTVYTAGDIVAYQGALYKALWWTAWVKPDASPWGAWAELGAPVVTDEGTFPAWTDSWIYTGGEVVAHDGHLWKAKWWTRNQEPGGSWWGPWQDLGAY
ncbi:ExeM/NucH family extracellular endonuclease [Agromyces sp. LHK192]|uniref:ExeM/NucH family extracellular endonuclease n=1 Tax=Agromyces sp. LHK192 TaxID=2498704 RepID=UPI000FD94BFB|nr:ExeM/NucH family extracellular endonuclease [Agromyces sp. LHK192]